MEDVNIRLISHALEDIRNYLIATDADAKYMEQCEILRNEITKCILCIMRIGELK